MARDPARPGIGLRMSQMNRVLDHPADDLTITVEPGLTLAELNRHLAKKRQWLPIDAPEPARATVGGIVATNACGPRRYCPRYDRRLLDRLPCDRRSRRGICWWRPRGEKRGRV